MAMRKNTKYWILAVIILMAVIFIAELLVNKYH